MERKGDTGKGKGEEGGKGKVGGELAPSLLGGIDAPDNSVRMH